MKFPSALRNYLQDNTHVQGMPVVLTELKEFKDSLTPEERDAAIEELRSYGYEIEA